MKLNLITVSLATLVAAGAFPAHAGPQAHVVCGYHHTLGDDAIMMFGKANQAMWHDFFGNTHTDAVSTYQTLRAQPDTTCDNKADSSGYWAPSMKLPDGEIVNPAYQKTYYQSTNVGNIRSIHSRPGWSYWQAIITVLAPVPQSPFYVPTAKVTPTR